MNKATQCIPGKSDVCVFAIKAAGKSNRLGIWSAANTPTVLIFLGRPPNVSISSKVFIFREVTEEEKRRRKETDERRRKQDEEEEEVRRRRRIETEREKAAARNWKSAPMDIPYKKY